MRTLDLVAGSIVFLALLWAFVLFVRAIVLDAVAMYRRSRSDFWKLHAQIAAFLAVILSLIWLLARGYFP